MNPKLKLGLYVTFTVGALIFGFLAFASYKKIHQKPDAAADASSLENPALEPRISAKTSKGFSKVALYGGLFFFNVVGLGLLGGHAVAAYFGSRAVKVLYNDDGEGVKDPDYDAAEQEWANGNHLEAIRLMRDYLQKNPREIHAAIRIAEIYEKDLKNYLAAALEYEEVLKHKLAPERWGWSAIHLCNLYFKLNKQEPAVALLQRIVNEYGETPAAEKARKRLAQIQGEDPNAVASEEIAEEAPAEDPAPTAPGGLPPGFRMKKG